MTYNAKDLITVPFPFTDFSVLKTRPALIIHRNNLDDILIAAMTSTPIPSIPFETITDSDLASGAIKGGKGNVLYMKLFTLHSRQVIKRFGILNDLKYSEIISRIIEELT